MMELAIAAFTLGAMFILVGLVGGDLSYRGLTIPRVGALPRFTTTIAGCVFLLISLSIFLVNSVPANGAQPPPDPSPTTPANPTGPASPSAGQEPMREVGIAVVDELAANQVAEEVAVFVDGMTAGQISCSRDEPDGCVLRFSVTAGRHAFEMSGRLLLDTDELIETYGRGSFVANRDSVFALTFSADGSLDLAAAH
jgi:hypothetical protein